uniref:Uncharacterized protein n=1 Tax=Anguilla anguilla TaxID=7936 RepID=A0A0E9RRV6_ANGAN
METQVYYTNDCPFVRREIFKICLCFGVVQEVTSKFTSYSIKASL